MRSSATQFNYKLPANVVVVVAVSLFAVAIFWLHCLAFGLGRTSLKRPPSTQSEMKSPKRRKLQNARQVVVCVCVCMDKENVEPICPLAEPEMQIVVSARACCYKFKMALPVALTNHRAKRVVQRE